MDGERAACRDIGLARGARILIALAADDEVGAVVANALDLGRGGDARHEDLRRNATPHRGISDGGTVIAARGGGDAGRRHLPQAEIGEGAARLEGAGMLHELELQQERRGGEAEIGGIDGDDRGSPDMRPDDRLGRSDLRSGNLRLRHHDSPWDLKG